MSNLQPGGMNLNHKCSSSDSSGFKVQTKQFGASCVFQLEHKPKVMAKAMAEAKAWAAAVEAAVGRCLTSSLDGCNQNLEAQAELGNLFGLFYLVLTRQEACTVFFSPLGFAKDEVVWTKVNLCESVYPNDLTDGAGFDQALSSIFPEGKTSGMVRC